MILVSVADFGRSASLASPFHVSCVTRTVLALTIGTYDLEFFPECFTYDTSLLSKQVRLNPDSIFSGLTLWQSPTRLL